MGISYWITSTQASCTSSLPLPLPLWLLLIMLLLPLPMELQPTLHQPMLPPSMWRRSSLPSPLLMNTVWLMTTPRLTSRRLRLKMLKERLLDLSPLLSLTDVSRLPPTLLTTTMDLLLRSPMRAPLCTPLSPRRDMVTTPPLPTRPPSLLMLLPLLTSLLPKSDIF